MGDKAGYYSLSDWEECPAGSAVCGIRFDLILIIMSYNIIPIRFDLIVMMSFNKIPIRFDLIVIMMSCNITSICSCRWHHVLYITFASACNTRCVSPISSSGLEFRKVKLMPSPILDKLKSFYTVARFLS